VAVAAVARDPKIEERILAGPAANNKFAIALQGYRVSDVIGGA